MKSFYIEYWKIAEALKMSFLVNKRYWKTGIKFISFPAVLLLTCAAEGQVSCGILECLADPQNSHTPSAVHWMTSEYVSWVNENCVCCASQSCAVMPAHPYKFSSLSQLPKYSVYNIVFVCLFAYLFIRGQQMYQVHMWRSEDSLLEGVSSIWVLEIELRSSDLASCWAPSSQS